MGIRPLEVLSSHGVLDWSNLSPQATLLGSEGFPPVKWGISSGLSRVSPIPETCRKDTAREAPSSTFE